MSSATLPDALPSVAQDERLVYYRLAMPGAALSVLLPLVLHAYQPFLTVFDLWALPLMALMFVSLTVVSWRSSHVRVLEILLLVGWNAALLARWAFGFTAPGAGAVAGLLATSQPWIMLMLLVNGWTLPSRRGIGLNVAVVVSLALLAALNWSALTLPAESMLVLNTVTQFLLACMVVLFAQWVIVAKTVAFTVSARDAAQQARLDALTALPNRRALSGLLAEQEGQPGLFRALALIDVDHFKRVNDQFGHARGDDVLKDLAALMAQHAALGSAHPSSGRSGSGHHAPGRGVVGRYGGEEFLYLLNVPDAPAALAACESLRELVEQTPCGGLSLTISVGLVTTTQTLAPEELLGAADLALYDAKGAGRNRVKWAEVPLAGTQEAPAREAQVA